MYEVMTTPLRVKAAGPDDGLEAGHFEAYASVFGNVDSYGDIVERGAFTRTLEDWAAKGETIPVLWGHDMQDPFANIGGVLSAEEDDHGLKITGQLDLDNPTAAQVYRLLKGRRTNRMSFAYSVRDSEKAADGLHLKDLDLFEVSVVQVPANELAEVTLVKQGADLLAKAGRVLSAKNETKVREAIAALTELLEANEASEATEDGEKANEPTDAKSTASEEISSVVADELKSVPSVDAQSAIFNFYAAIYAEKG